MLIIFPVSWPSTYEDYNPVVGLVYVYIYITMIEGGGPLFVSIRSKLNSQLLRSLTDHVIAKTKYTGMSLLNYHCVV